MFVELTQNNFSLYLVKFLVIRSYLMKNHKQLQLQMSTQANQNQYSRNVQTLCSTQQKRPTVSTVCNTEVRVS